MNETDLGYLGCRPDQRAGGPERPAAGVNGVNGVNRVMA